MDGSLGGGSGGGGGGVGGGGGGQSSGAATPNRNNYGVAQLDQLLVPFPQDLLGLGGPHDQLYGSSATSAQTSSQGGPGSMGPGGASHALLGPEGLLGQQQGQHSSLLQHVYAQLPQGFDQAMMSQLGPNLSALFGSSGHMLPEELKLVQNLAAQQSRKRGQRTDPVPQSGFKGVSWNSRMKAWLAFYVTENGERKSKTFSTRKLGLDEARLQAIAFCREKQEQRREARKRLQRSRELGQSLGTPTPSDKSSQEHMMDMGQLRHSSQSSSCPSSPQATDVAYVPVIPIALDLVEKSGHLHPLELSLLPPCQFCSRQPYPFLMIVSEGQENVYGGASAAAAFLAEKGAGDQLLESEDDGGTLSRDRSLGHLRNGVPRSLDDYNLQVKVESALGSAPIPSAIPDSTCSNSELHQDRPEQTGLGGSSRMYSSGGQTLSSLSSGMGPSAARTSCSDVLRQQQQQQQQHQHLGASMSQSALPSNAVNFPSSEILRNALFLGPALGYGRFGESAGHGMTSVGDVVGHSHGARDPSGSSYTPGLSHHRARHGSSGRQSSSGEGVTRYAEGASMGASVKTEAGEDNGILENAGDAAPAAHSPSEAGIRSNSDELSSNFEKVTHLEKHATRRSVEQNSTHSPSAESGGSDGEAETSSGSGMLREAEESTQTDAFDVFGEPLDFGTSAEVGRGSGDDRHGTFPRVVNDTSAAPAESLDGDLTGGEGEVSDRSDRSGVVSGSDAITSQNRTLDNLKHADGEADAKGASSAEEQPNTKRRRIL